MPTISDVAKHAKLSRSTVSRVLNNQPYVSKEKKEAVLKAMKELGYTPNSAAQTLRKQKTDMIAVLVPRLTNPFFAYLVESLEKNARKYGYQTLICNTKYDKQREIEFLHYIKSRQVDGIIMTAVQSEWKDIEKVTLDGPIILCNDYLEEAKVPKVILNQQSGGYIATRHLIRRGHTKIGYCRGGTGGKLTDDRYKGYVQAMEEFGLETNKSWEFSGILGINESKLVVDSILSMENRPSALFAGGDEAAVGIIAEAKRRGLRVPDDLAVIGFDDQPIARVVEPALTTIRQPIDEIGQKTIEVMIDLLSGKSKVHETYELPLELIVRGSS